VDLDGERAARLRAWLGERLGCRAVRIVRLAPLAGGAIQDNHALDLEVEGGAWHGALALVLRSDAPATLATSLGRAEEFAVLETARAAGVTVPEPLWLCTDRAVIGRPFYLMRRLPGVAAGHRLVRDPALTEATRERLVERLGAELARLHAVRPPEPRLAFLAPPAGGAAAAARIATYRGYLDALPEPQPVLEWGLAWLERNAPPPGEVVLCHSDFRTGNYLVHEGELAGILDWEFAAWSDPHEDLAWFCARCWRFGAWEREAGGMASREAFYRGYQRASGRRIDAERIAYWEVMAAARWALIALQQAERHCSGGERSLELALTGQMVAEMELEMLDGIEALEGRQLAQVPA